ncbi:uncharacterized protein LOC134101075 [Sardina pilchardus]|uniref:uncharacterized protein LOC134101075 n=1 Tax=Sardina pilchardus TaxID=27697 RepID=UPI002E123732
MIISALVIFTALAEVPIWAKVVDDFNECRQFFYKETEPHGIDQNAKKICQQYAYSGNLYASLYSTSHRIPMYSAYIFDSSCDNKEGQKGGDWLFEPMLSGIPEHTMMPYKNYENYRDTIKVNQAVNDDYSFSAYDRGHLNPNSFQCEEDGRTATFTLTNSVPMDASFYTVHWKQWEELVRGILRNQSVSEGTAYLVTGAVPSQDDRIPRQGEFDDISARDFNRVTVPTHVWTAVCYKHNADDEKSFSFGYIGLNDPDGTINVRTVPQLNAELFALYGKSIVKIFTDDCFSTNRKSDEMIKSIQLAISERIQMSDDFLNVFHSALNKSNDDVRSSLKRSEVREHIIAEAIDCIDSCQYKSHCRGYCCYDQSEREIPCSPDYSNVTVDGATCRTHHTCGLHGYSYYWCNTETSWDYCSPPPLPQGKGVGKRKGGGSKCRSDYNCGWYGYRYTWCYTDNHKWDYCCNINDDPYSALKGKTCMTESPCDYYSKNYLWCWTTDGSWEYCCTQWQ